MSSPIDLDKRRPRPGSVDRSQICGALWAAQVALEWAAAECVTIGAPSEAREIDACAERLYYAAERLYPPVEDPG